MATADAVTVCVDLPGAALGTFLDGPRICAHVSGTPSPAWGDVATLTARGLTVVELTDTLDLTAGDAQVRLGVLAWLRDAASVGLPVTWRGTVPAALTPLVTHLPPPEGAAAADWRRAHRFLACYWRRGPGFALVRDARDVEAVARYTIDEPVMVSLVERLAVPVSVSSLDDAERSALADLLDAGLAVELDGWALFLPYRMSRVPVPCTDL